MIEVLAGCARERAEARQGSTLERSFGGADACHRNVDYPLLRVACQQDFAASKTSSLDCQAHSIYRCLVRALRRTVVISRGGPIMERDDEVTF